MKRSRGLLVAVFLVGACENFDKFDHPPAADGSAADGPTVSPWAMGHYGGDTFYGAWGADANHLVLVAASAEIAVSSDGGKTFAGGSIDSDFDYRGVWGTSASDYFTVGLGGIIRHQATTPSVFALDQPPWVASEGTPPPALYGVWGASANDFVVVGAGGMIVRWDGNKWSAPVDGGTKADLLAVTGFGMDRFAASNAGEILHSTDGGATWIKQPVAPDPLEAIFADSVTDVWAVGGAAIYHSTDGSSWSSVPAPAPLHGIWAGGGEAFAVGDGGLIMHFTDGNWTAEQAPTAANLRAVWFAAPSNALAAGASGAIARRK